MGGRPLNSNSSTEVVNGSLRKGCMVLIVVCCSLLFGACAGPWRHGDQNVRSGTSGVDGDLETSVATSARTEDRPLFPSVLTTASYLESSDAVVLEPADEGPRPAYFETHGASPPVAIAVSLDGGEEASVTPPAFLPELTDPGAGKPWTMDELLQFTLEHHPSLRARQHEVEIARAKLVTARLLPNPQLVMDTESPVHDADTTDLTGRVTFEIPLGGKRRLRESAARSGVCLARAALSRNTEEVLVEAADAAIEVLYLQELLALRTQQSELASKKAKAESPEFDRQTPEVNLVDKVQADIGAAAMETRRRDAETLLTTARLRASRAIGLSPPELLAVRGQLVFDSAPLLPLDAVLAAARRSKPELEEVRAALTQSQSQHELAHAEAIPDPEMGPRYQDALGEAKDEIGARFNIDLPLFDRNQGGILETAAQVRANRAILDGAELAVLSDMTSAYMELQSIRSTLGFYETRAMQLVDYYEDLLSKPEIRKTISEKQATEILEELLELRVRELELRYRYVRLLGRMQLVLGIQITQSHAPA